MKLKLFAILILVILAVPIICFALQYVKFSTMGEAVAYQAKLQAHHDAVYATGPRIVDCIDPTYDGMFALTLQDDDYPDVGNGIVVDSLEPPIEEGLP